MSQFKQMLQDAANIITTDDDIENVLVIVTKKPNADGKVEQHTLTNIACPLGVITATMHEALQQIVKEKVARLGVPQES